MLQICPACKLYFILQDKILQSTGRGHSVTVTNDGATILKSLHIDNPAAKVLVGILHTIVYAVFLCLMLLYFDLSIRYLNVLVQHPPFYYCYHSNFKSLVLYVCW